MLYCRVNTKCQGFQKCLLEKQYSAVRETVPPWQEEQQMHPADSYMSQALLLNVIRMSCMYVKSHVVCCFDIISSLCVSLSL